MLIASNAGHVTGRTKMMFQKQIEFQLLLTGNQLYIPIGCSSSRTSDKLLGIRSDNHSLASRDLSSTFRPRIMMMIISYGVCTEPFAASISFGPTAWQNPNRIPALPIGILYSREYAHAALVVISSGRQDLGTGPQENIQKRVGRVYNLHTSEGSEKIEIDTKNLEDGPEDSMLKVAATGEDFPDDIW